MLNYLRYIFLFALALLLNSSNARAQDYNKDAVIARVVLDKNLKTLIPQHFDLTLFISS